MGCSHDKVVIDNPKDFRAMRSPIGFAYKGNFNDKSSIAHHCLVGTYPEEQCLRTFKQFCKKAKNFVDVGTNTGLYNLVYGMENEGGEILCYEPQKRASLELAENLVINNQYHQTKIKNVCLGEKAEHRSLFLAGTGSSLLASFPPPQTYGEESVLVQTLDSELKQEGWKSLDLLKIDVEGSELGVLKGGLESIRKFQPVIFIEISSFSNGCFANPHFEQTIMLLENEGYRIYKIREWNLIWWGYTREQDIGMYLCLPPDNETMTHELVTLVKEERNRELPKIWLGRFWAKVKSVLR